MPSYASAASKAKEYNPGNILLHINVMVFYIVALLLNPRNKEATEREINMQYITVTLASLQIVRLCLARRDG